MCAISPRTTEGVVEGVDDGYPTPNDSPIPPDRSGIPRGAGIQPDEIVDTDDEDEESEYGQFELSDSEDESDDEEMEN